MLKQSKEDFSAQNWTKYQQIFRPPARSISFPFQIGFRQSKYYVGFHFFQNFPWIGWRTINLKRYLEVSLAQILTTCKQFFCRAARSKIRSLSDSIHAVTHLTRPSFDWIIPWLDWKAIFVEILLGRFPSAIFDNVSSIFCKAARQKTLSPSDFIQAVKILPRRSFSLNESMTRLKSNLCWNAI